MLLARFSQNAAMSRFGWNREKLEDLSDRLRRVRINFNELTRGAGPKLSVVISAYPPMKKEAMLEFEEDGSKGEIRARVYLSHGPGVTLGHAPYGLSQKLAEMIIEDPRITMERGAVYLAASRLIDEGSKEIVEFYRTNRLILLCTNAVRVHFMVAMNYLTNGITLNKIAFLLLRPNPVPRVPVEKGVLIGLESLEKRVRGMCLEGNETHAWAYLRELALNAEMARAAGSSELEGRCFDLISTDLGMDLAYIELVQLHSQRQLFKTPLPGHDTQLARASEGFQAIYRIYKEFADCCYDGLSLPVISGD